MAAVCVFQDWMGTPAWKRLLEAIDLHHMPLVFTEAIGLFELPFERLTIEYDLPIIDRDTISGQANEPLDHPVGAPWVDENDDVTANRLMREDPARDDPLG